MPVCTCTSCECVLHKKSFSLFNSSGLKLKNKWISWKCPQTGKTHLNLIYCHIHRRFPKFSFLLWPAMIECFHAHMYTLSKGYKNWWPGWWRNHPDSKYDSHFVFRVRPDYEFLSVRLINWQKTSSGRVRKSANLVRLGLSDVFMEPLITTQILYQRKIMPNNEIKMKYHSFTDS